MIKKICLLFLIMLLVSCKNETRKPDGVYECQLKGSTIVEMEINNDDIKISQDGFSMERKLKSENSHYQIVKSKVSFDYDQEYNTLTLRSPSKSEEGVVCTIKK